MTFLFIIVYQSLTFSFDAYKDVPVTKYKTLKDSFNIYLSSMTTNDVYGDSCDNYFDIYYTCESLIYTSFSDLL